MRLGQGAGMSVTDEQREKRSVAQTSLLAAMVPLAMTLGAGLLTGSLALLAEAAHLGMDIVATLLTLLAVRLADRPPDRDHPYGHGKIESLSAFFEAGLLLLAAVWIIYEAIQRLFFQHVEVEPNVWAFLVIVVSIVVDYGRSRALGRAAAKYGSPALEADAAHFRTHLWSSGVVLLGLGVIQVGRVTGQSGPWERADAAAAIIVALVTTWVGGTLAKQTVDALLDRAPEDVAHRLAEAAAGVPGVLECRRVRLRRAGSKYFADVIIAVPRTTTLAEAHDVSEATEEAVRGLLPRADVVVHVDPAVSRAETAAEQVQFVASQRGLHAHHVRVRQVEEQFEVDLHLEVDPRLPLGRAHAVADDLEHAIGQENPAIRVVQTHLEGQGHTAEPRREVTDDRADLVARVTALAERFAGAGGCHEVRVYQQSGAQATAPDLVLHCSFPEDLPIAEVHERSGQIERALRAELGSLGSVLVHAEPRG